MNLTTVRDELVEQLGSITGVTVSERVPAVLQPPHLFVSAISVQPAQTFDGLANITFDIVALVSRADDDTGWDTLSALMGTDSGSVDYALNANSNLDNTVQWVRVEEFADIRGDYSFAGAEYLGCVCRITGTGF